MNGVYGVAVGIGIGYLNASMIGMPGWANILMMACIAILGVLHSEGESP